MKKNSIIEMQTKYQTPRVVEIAFKPEGPLCQSTSFDNGGGNSGYTPGDDGWGNDEWD